MYQNCITGTNEINQTNYDIFIVRNGCNFTDRCMPALTGVMVLTSLHVKVFVLQQSCIRLRLDLPTGSWWLTHETLIIATVRKAFSFLWINTLLLFVWSLNRPEEGNSSFCPVWQGTGGVSVTLSSPVDMNISVVFRNLLCSRDDSLLQTCVVKIL